MENQNKGFIIYYDNEVIVGRLSDDEAGKLFKSLFPYATEHIKPDFENSPALAMAFDVLSLTIDRNAERYKQKCEKNRENIKKRWEKSNTSEYGRNETNTNEYNRVPNKEKEKDKNKEKNKEKNLYNAHFTELWLAYPRKIDKAAAYKQYQARLNEGYSEEELLQAVKLYAEECKTENRELRFIKHCKTFLGVNGAFAEYIRREINTNETNEDNGRTRSACADFYRRYLGESVTS